MPPLVNIKWLDCTDSTNKAARRLYELNPEGDYLSVVAARRQTRGRGQGDHIWYSEDGSNLTFSLLLRRPFCFLGASDSLTLICTAVCPVIQEFLLEEGVESRIKEPNDIWVGDRKICGILIENIISGSEVVASIIGVGLNLNQTLFPPELPNPVSLFQLTGKNYKPETVLVGLVDKFCKKNIGK